MNRLLAVFVLAWLAILSLAVFYQRSESTEISAAWIGVFGTLAGTIFGLLITLGHDKWKEQTREAMLRGALDAELQSNMSMFATKLESIRRYQEAIQRNAIVGAFDRPFMTAIYRTHLAEFTSFLELVEINALHLIYSRLDHLDEILRRLEPANGGDAVARFATVMNDFEPFCQSTQILIESYLQRTTHLLGANATSQSQSAASRPNS